MRDFISFHKLYYSYDDDKHRHIIWKYLIYHNLFSHKLNKRKKEEKEKIDSNKTI